MLNLKKVSFVFVLVAYLTGNAVYSQVVINEASNKNYTQIFDEDNDNEDWIELYNTDTKNVNLYGWSLSDSRNKPGQWIFPGSIIMPGGYKIIFASGKNRKGIYDHWEAAVLSSDTFNYIVPVVQTALNWKDWDFVPTGWKKGIAGFGFGDNDDSTLVSDTSKVIYISRKFTIVDTSAIAGAIACIDYDDGFVAYLNGVEICRKNITGTPTYKSFANGDHEAIMYMGGLPTQFPINLSILRSAWKMGDNLFSVEVHNLSKSSDVSLIPFLFFALRTPAIQFKPVPEWFNFGALSELHTNFKISTKGEKIFLWNAAKALIDSLSVSDLMVNYSIGNEKDGAITKGIFLVATPGKSNNTSFAYKNGYTVGPSFSIRGGFYPQPIDLVLVKSDIASEIRYTKDGSEPTSASPLFISGVINISKTTAIKAKCFVAGRIPSKTATATYFINNNHTVPVLSVSTANENLFGAATGICDNPNADWVKPCYIEYFDKQQQKQFSQAASIQIDGGLGGSRTKPQHSFRIEPGNGALGDGDLNYKLIPDRPNRTNYESFFLRNGSNQYLILPHKDAAAVQTLGRGSNNYYSAYAPVVVYINGVYWGLYELREKINDNYFAVNYGANTDSIDILSYTWYSKEVLRAVNGSVDKFWSDYDAFLGMNTTNSNYLAQVDSFLDIDYYTDYIIAQSWMANKDWPTNNIKIMRSNISNYRWRFELTDMDLALAPSGWTDYNFDHINYMRGQSIYFIKFWQELMKNTTYKNYFINRFADLMNTTFQYSYFEQSENKLYSQIYPEMRGEFTKWGEGPTADSYMKAFASNHKSFLYNLQKRTPVVRQNIVTNYALPKQINLTLDVTPFQAGKIKISTIIPDSFPWKGTYFDGVPVTITALPNPGYKFVLWDNNAFISDVTSPKFTNTISTANVTFKANFVVDDKPFSAITISEICYKDAKSIPTSDWVELYNYGTAEADLNGWYLRDENPSHIFKITNCIIPAKEYAILSKDVAKFKAVYPSIQNVIGNLGYGLGASESNLMLYNKSDSLIANVHYIDTIPWPQGIAGTGRTLELKDPYRSLNKPDNWFAGCIGGSPGNSYSLCIDSIVISEIYSKVSTDVDMGNFVELLNITDKPVNIGGWAMGNSNELSTFRLPDQQVIKPGERLVIAQDIGKLKSFFPNIKNICGGFNFSFATNTDLVCFYDRTGRIRLSVKYDYKSPWPLLSKLPYSLEFINSNGDVNNGKNWFAGCAYGSPGKPYNIDECLTSSVNEAINDNNIRVYPNPAGNIATISLNKAADGICEIRIYNLLGTLIQHTNFNAGNSTTKKIDLSAMQPGIYILSVKQRSVEKRIKIIHK